MPRLGFAWPSPAYLRGPALADRQPAWKSGLAQRILAEKMGERVGVVPEKNSALTLRCRMHAFGMPKMDKIQAQNLCHSINTKLFSIMIYFS